MSSRDVRPYFVPDPGLVNASTWLRAVDGGWEELGDSVQNWDYRTRLRLKCTLSVDLQTVRQTTGITDGTPLAIMVGYRASDTYLTAPPKRIPLDTNFFEITLKVDPRYSGSAIEITRRIVLERDRLSASVGEARHAGSVLWQDEHLLRLTGDEPMFPSEVVDFEAFGLDKNASWHLLMPASPDDPAMGALLLLLNPRDTKLVSAVQTERETSEANSVLVAEMEENLITEIVRWALSRWDELADCDGQSFGHAARVLTARVLPEPEAWASESLTNASMDLRSAAIAGIRAIGYGRQLR